MNDRLVQAAAEASDPGPCRGRCEFHGFLFCKKTEGTCEEYVDTLAREFGGGDVMATESVIEWAWANDRSDVRAWRNGYPIYQRSNWAEVLTDEVGERATEFIYAENNGEFRWPPALDTWTTTDLLRRSSDVVWPALAREFGEPT